MSYKSDVPDEIDVTAVALEMSQRYAEGQASASDLYAFLRRIGDLDISSDTLLSLRNLARELSEDRKFESSILLWAVLLLRSPETPNFLRRVIQCLSNLPEPQRYIDCVPDQCLTFQAWHEVHDLLGNLIRKSWNSELSGRFDLMRRLVQDKATDLTMRVVLLKCLSEAECQGLVHEWMENWPLSDMDLVSTADAFELAGHPGAAGLLFSEFERGKPLSFHTSLLGARISVQLDDFVSLARYREICSGTAKTESVNASPVYHLLIPDLRDAIALRESASMLGATLSNGKLQISIFWRYVEALSRAFEVVGLLRLIADETDDPTLGEQIELFISVLEGNAIVSDVLRVCESGPQTDDLMKRSLLHQVLSRSDTREALQSALDIINTKDASTKSMLRALATNHWKIGRFDLAAAAWKALAKATPADDWARINAIFCLHASGETQIARELTEGWATEDKAGPVLIHIANAFARVGLSDKAKLLFEKCGHLFQGQNLPAEHQTTLARGLILYGNYSLAKNYLPDVPDRNYPQSSAAILDPGHSDGSGHHGTYNSFFAEFIREQTGNEPEIIVGLCSRGKRIAARRVYAAASFEPYVYNDFVLGRSELDGLNHSFRSDIGKLFAEHIPDILIMHSMRAVMLKGMVDWLRDLGERRPTKIVIGLIEADHLADADQTETYTNALAGPLEELSALEVETLILFAETSYAVDWLQKHSGGIRVHKFPYLAAARAAEKSLQRTRKPAHAPVFGILGATRAERGFNSIFRAIEEAGPEQGEKWLMQFDEEKLERFGDNTLDFARRIEGGGYDQVQFLKGFLSDDDYYGAFAQLDCIVLPYFGRYAVSGSGVLYEAIYSRKFLIVSAGTTLALELAELGYPHKAVDLDTPGALSAAISQTAINSADITSEIEHFFKNDPELPLARFTKLFAN